MGNKVNCLFLIHVFFFLSNRDGFLDATSAESRYMNVVDSLSKFPFISRSYDCDESCSESCSVHRSPLKTLFVVCGRLCAALEEFSLELKKVCFIFVSCHCVVSLFKQ